MNILIIKPFDLKSDGSTQSIQAGTLLNLPDNKAQRLIDAGYAKLEAFDVAHWSEEIRRMVAEFGANDPCCGCWEWISNNKPELLQANKTGFRDVGQAFQKQDAVKVGEAIQKTTDSFWKCLEAWERRDEHTQPHLLAA